MKTLQQFLDENGLKPTPWAILNKIAPSVISRYLNGKGVSKDNALKIQNATDGAVTVMEILYPEKSTAERSNKSQEQPESAQRA